jgi:hypothetical protein
MGKEEKRDRRKVYLRIVDNCMLGTWVQGRGKLSKALKTRSTCLRLDNDN